MRKSLFTILALAFGILVATDAYAGSGHVYRVTLSMPQSSKPFAEFTCSPSAGCTTRQPLLAVWGPASAEYELSLNRDGQLEGLQATARNCRFSLEWDREPIPPNTLTEGDIVQEYCGSLIRSDPPLFQYRVLIYIVCLDCGDTPTDRK
jgi:hypothetical protein